MLKKMEGKRHVLSPNLEDMKRLVHEKAGCLLKDLTADNMDYFAKESAVLARDVMEKYVFAVYDYYTIGDYAIQDLDQRETFTNFKTGYQQKMLDWIEQHKPDIELMAEIPVPPQEPSDKKWHFVALGVGTAGAVGFEIGRRCMEGHRYWIGIAIELITLVASYLIYEKEKSESDNYTAKLYQYESELKKKTFVNETISQMEKWVMEGEAYSNELLTAYNL